MIQMKISPDIENLDKLNKKYNWIPSSKNIRPSEKVLKLKDKTYKSILNFYESFKDYIFDTVFGLPIIMNDNNKLFCRYKLKLFILEKNIFPYDLPKITEHYILWYTYKYNGLDDEIITKNIKYELKRIKNENCEFVWYENPKANNEVYHIQVFVHKKN